MKNSGWSWLSLFVLTVSIVAQARIVSREYYEWNEKQQKFAIVTAEKMRHNDREKIYLFVEWNEKGEGQQSWVTTGNDDGILPGSVVLGYRLSREIDGAAFYYRLARDLNWYPVNPSFPPAIWRQNPRVRSYLSEEASEDWCDGHLFTEDRRPDPITTPDKFEREPVLKPVTKSVEKAIQKPMGKPIQPPREKPTPPAVVAKEPTLPKPRTVPVLGCEIEITPSSAVVGGTVLLAMESFGAVDSATLDGAAVDFPTVLRSRTADQVGEITIEGEVVSRKEKATCQAKFTVLQK